MKKTVTTFIWDITRGVLIFIVNVQKPLINRRVDVSYPGAIDV